MVVAAARGDECASAAPWNARSHAARSTGQRRIFALLHDANGHRVFTTELIPPRDYVDRYRRDEPLLSLNLL